MSRDKDSKQCVKLVDKELCKKKVFDIGRGLAVKMLRSELYLA